MYMLVICFVAPDVISLETERALQASEGSYGRRPGMKGSPPTFIQLPPTDITVHEGEKMTLTCIVEGDPRPTGILQLHDPRPTGILQLHDPRPTGILQLHDPRPTGILQLHDPRPADFI